MKTLKFKTNINCISCVESVTPFLKKAGDVVWKVDTANKDKILEVKGDNISPMKIMVLVREAGFKAEPLRAGFFGKLFGKYEDK